ncbi:hypothetical protein EBZ35_04755 [bacterium]|nr:hypothetical protein [bacterium]
MACVGAGCGVEEAWKVGSVETGRELQVAVARGKGAYRVLVVNRALCVSSELSRMYDVIVADEAHQPQTLQSVRRCFPEQPILFVTACPMESTQLIETLRQGRRGQAGVAHKDFSESCFVVQKTMRVMSLFSFYC